jgi:hypothetical protein
VSTHAFAGVEWPGDEFPSFFELPPNTPMVYLSFAPVCDLDQARANDKRRPGLFKGVIQSEHPLIYILSPSSEDAMPDGPRVYVVPSGTVQKTEALQKASEMVLERNYRSGGKVPVSLTFKDTEFIDEFDIKRDDTVDWLRRVVFGLQADARARTSRQAYLTCQREVARHYLRVWNKEVALPLHRAPEV